MLFKTEPDFIVFWEDDLVINVLVIKHQDLSSDPYSLHTTLSMVAHTYDLSTVTILTEGCIEVLCHPDF